MMSDTLPTGSPLLPTGLEAPPLARRMACWMYEGVLLFGVVFIAGIFSAHSARPATLWTTGTH